MRDHRLMQDDRAHGGLLRETFHWFWFGFVVGFVYQLIRNPLQTACGCGCLLLLLGSLIVLAAASALRSPLVLLVLLVAVAVVFLLRARR